jgi:DNA-binding transcriptional MerR regulator
MAQKPVLAVTATEACEVAARLDGKRYGRLEDLARRLGYWSLTGLIPPSVRWMEAQGSTRLYGVRDVALLRLVLRLRERGHVPLWNVKPIIGYLGDELARGLRPGSRKVLVIDGWKARIVSAGEAASDSGDYQVPLGELMRGVAAEIRKMRRGRPLRVPASDWSTVIAAAHRAATMGVHEASV